MSDEGVESWSVCHIHKKTNFFFDVFAIELFNWKVYLRFSWDCVGGGGVYSMWAKDRGDVTTCVRH